jgi:hypothetical protein
MSSGVEAGRGEGRYEEATHRDHEGSFPGAVAGTARGGGAADDGASGRVPPTVDPQCREPAPGRGSGTVENPRQ